MWTMLWEVWTASTLGVPVLTIKLWMTAVNKNGWDRFTDTCCTQAKPLNPEMQVQPPGTSGVQSSSHQSPLSMEWTKQSDQHLRRTASKSVSGLLYLLEYNNLLILQPKPGVKGNRACLMLSDVGASDLERRPLACQPSLQEIVPTCPLRLC